MCANAAQSNESPRKNYSVVAVVDLARAGLCTLQSAVVDRLDNQIHSVWNHRQRCNVLCAPAAELMAWS